MLKKEGNCLVCNNSTIKEITEYRDLKRITSDSKIWPSGGQIGYCSKCASVQKIHEEKLISEINNIYENYELYFQGQGEEQKIFVNNVGQPRSQILLQYFFTILEKEELKMKKKWLDFGCGTGHLLRSLSILCPDFYLYGADISEKNRRCIESISGVQKYFANGLKDLDNKFDIISLSHVLEHIPDPIEFLCSLSTHLNKNSHIMIAVPNWLQNPFDLLVADHIHHFTKTQLVELITKAGLTLVSITDNLVPKELILVAKHTAALNNNLELEIKDPIFSDEQLNKTIHWLKSLVNWPKENKYSNIGVFGTALAATWLDSSHHSLFSFFVDEDHNRAGSYYLNRPVFLPKQIQVEAKVLVPLPTPIAKRICDRLNKPGKEQYYAPPYFKS
jgi:2-polyprenyl-3-methyl-5-hydroxy-6-metoxy-1,4-benzoquinol methylase